MINLTIIITLYVIVNYSSKIIKIFRISINGNYCYYIQINNYIYNIFFSLFYEE